MLGRMRCFRLGWHRSHCRNHDCCKNKLRRCTRASACVGQVQDHVWGCDTSRGPGSEMLDLAPCLDFPFLATILRSPENRQRSQPHLWVGSHHPGRCQNHPSYRSKRTCRKGRVQGKRAVIESDDGRTDKK